jgi:uncharacterized protein (UPF0303 family)
MEDIDELINRLEHQERELQFTEFNSATALEIGLMLIEKAKKESKIITIDITRNGHQLFHYSFDGTGPDNDQWVIRKNRVVNRFTKSSFLVGRQLFRSEKSMEEAFLLNSMEYAAHGGAFPIILKNTGVIGTITVSGLPQQEDHELVVSIVTDYLKKTFLKKI